MLDVILFYLAIIGFLIFWSKLPVLIGGLINTLGDIPDLESTLDPDSKKQFQDQRERNLKENMPIVYGYRQRGGW